MRHLGDKLCAYLVIIFQGYEMTQAESTSQTPDSQSASQQETSENTGSQSSTNDFRVPILYQEWISLRTEWTKSIFAVSIAGAAGAIGALLQFGAGMGPMAGNFMIGAAIVFSFCAVICLGVIWASSSYMEAILGNLPDWRVDRLNENLKLLAAGQRITLIAATACALMSAVIHYAEQRAVIKEQKAADITAKREQLLKDEIINAINNGETRPSHQ